MINSGNNVHVDCNLLRIWLLGHESVGNDRSLVVSPANIMQLDAVSPVAEAGGIAFRLTRLEGHTHFADWYARAYMNHPRLRMTSPHGRLQKQGPSRSNAVRHKAVLRLVVRREGCWTL